MSVNIQEFTPKLFTILKQGISKEQLFKEILSGLIVGIVALPLAIAFAIASGVSPEKGLITAIIAGFIISALGGSRVQIGGPTGAFIVIVYSIVQEHGVGGLTIATFMAGFIIIGMGIAKLGNLLKFIPYPLIVGFTSGIALIIFSSQIKDLFGLNIDQVPSNFSEQWSVYINNFDEVNIFSVLIAAVTLIITFGFHKITSKIPGSIIAILFCTVAVHIFQIPVATIGTKFGEIPNHFSIPAFPEVNFAIIKTLIQPALAIALLGGIESLLSAVVADGMIGGRHRSNIELIAQGIANLFSSLFGGIPATGAIARTATNIKNGGRTPIAGIVHAIFLLLIMIVFASYVKLIPLACLAGILVMVSYNMGEWNQFFALLKSNSMDVIILLTTFLLTVIFDLVIAIEVGIVLSSFMFMKRMGDALVVQNLSGIITESTNGEKLFEEELSGIPKDVLLYEINGPLFFGASRHFQDTLDNLNIRPKILILRMRYVPFIDATGLYRLKEVVKTNKNHGVNVILSGVNKNVRKEIENSTLIKVLDSKNVCDNITLSIIRAKEILAEIEKIA